ncbi:hypothetical protein [Gimesia sp.]|uniref:hypothetical protein n=1 Tax=Gimesia sp. TaxID=2024833 RepID=UPI003A93D6E8
MTNRRLEVPEDYVRVFSSLTAAVIAESSGYFTVRSAGAAIQAYKENKPLGCEWYSHISSQSGKGFFNPDEFLRINKDVISYAFANRHSANGRMNDYKYAKALVEKIQQYWSTA